MIFFGCGWSRYWISATRWVGMGGKINWVAVEERFGVLHSEEYRPGIPIRLMVGLHYLKHAFNESDETVVDRWVENPYWRRTHAQGITATGAETDGWRNRSRCGLPAPNVASPWRSERSSSAAMPWNRRSGT